tara:strand:- start:296 stop:535 length:240 start_codon:yes stop_codon:yes gene_type:complete
MVLGFILYETIDIAYNVGKIGYNSVTGLYNWYYDIKSEEQEEINRLDRLENKIDKISRLFEDNDLKEKINELNLKIKDK